MVDTQARQERQHTSVMLSLAVLTVVPIGSSEWLWRAKALQTVRQSNGTVTTKQSTQDTARSSNLIIYHDLGAVCSDRRNRG